MPVGRIHLVKAKSGECSFIRYLCESLFTSPLLAAKQINNFFAGELAGTELFNAFKQWLKTRNKNTIKIWQEHFDDGVPLGSIDDVPRYKPCVDIRLFHQFIAERFPLSA